MIFNDSPNPAVADVSLPSGITEWQTVDIATGSVQGSPLGLEPSPVSLSIKPMELAAFRLRARPEDSATASSAAPSAAVESHAGQDVSVALSDGWTLMLRGRADEPVPISVDSGWEQPGFSSYSGIGHYTCQFDRPPDGPPFQDSPEPSGLLAPPLHVPTTR